MAEVRGLGSLIRAVAGVDEVGPLAAALVGSAVSDMHVANGEGSLYLTTDRGIVELRAEGDCCSESWFADILGATALLGHRVERVEMLDLPSPEDARTRQEFDQAYGYRFVTTTGEACTVVFRNSSNGYYGGWLKNPEMVTAVPGDARRIDTDDWSA